MRLEKLYYRAFNSWRGKAGAFAKNRNWELLKLSNKQKLRYFYKWADAAGFNQEMKNQMIESNYV